MAQPYDDCEISIVLKDIVKAYRYCVQFYFDREKHDVYAQSHLLTTYLEMILYATMSKFLYQQMAQLNNVQCSEFFFRKFQCLDLFFRRYCHFNFMQNGFANCVNSHDFCFYCEMIFQGYLLTLL